GCYGIGPTRIMGTLVEIFNDDKGILWPKSVAPYQVHLSTLGTDEKTLKEADNLYNVLHGAGITVLYDDRDERAGAKFADADLIGIPLRLVLSSRTMETRTAEWKERNKDDAEMVDLNSVLERVKEFYN
ncbi:prolyl-tRNA synthetase, partial [Candidatus Pacearchaeota archaeon]|nr:prolyl-tRNA synthetase [Candidatus Pacearchaeota archaeon]